jgi:hypothetical protein
MIDFKDPMYLIMFAGAFLAGHVVQAKFDTISKIGNVVGMVPVIGDKLENLIDKLD